MTLTQLEYIVALDSFRHFGKAAAHCHIAQPSLSLQVQKLEEELKTTIFSRNNMPVTTTETGAIIIEQAKKNTCRNCHGGAAYTAAKKQPGRAFKNWYYSYTRPLLITLVFNVIYKKISCGKTQH